MFDSEGLDIRLMLLVAFGAVATPNGLLWLREGWMESVQG
jgi:hypothetical protein